MNSSGPERLFTLNSALRNLRQDPYFPKDWLRGKKLIGLIQNPVFSASPHNMTNLFIMLGASSSAAARTAAEIGSAAARVAFDTTIRHFSSSDLFMAMLATAEEHIKRFIKVGLTASASATIHGLLRDFGFAFAMSFPLGEVIKMYEVKHTLEAEITLLSHQYRKIVKPTELVMAASIKGEVQSPYIE